MGVLALAIGGCLQGGLPDRSGSPDLIDCNVDPRSCGLCLGDSDCPLAAPRCDPGALSCVPCLPEHDNCPAGLFCHASRGLYACGTCVTDQDCKRHGGGSCCGGACVLLDTDPENCGDCGHVCPPPQWSCKPMQGLCVGGACTSECGARSCDCNDDPADGCETHVDSDSLNCGACGHQCPTCSNLIASCANGVCTGFCDAPGYANCTEDPCRCDDLTFDTMSCGACGHVCTAPQGAVAICDNGLCGFRCQLGRGDCNGLRNDGCEVDLTADPVSCGRCGAVCPPMMPACVNSTCQR